MAKQQPWDNILKRLANKELILPILENQMRSDTWPDRYPIWVDSSPYYGAGDGYFHPSTHPLMHPRQLYYMFHPDHRHLIEHEPFSIQREMTLSMGSALHAVVQTQMIMTGMTSEEHIEVEYINTEHHVRGRTDMVFFHPSEGPLVVELKALALDTPILTTDGWSTMGDLSVGDEVYAPDGQPTKVTNVSPIYLKGDCYRVTTRDGQSVVADGDHRWFVRDTNRGGRGRDRALMDRVMTTREIFQAGLRTSQNSHQYRFALPVCDALQHPEIELPIDPWLLGMWLGDGDTKNSVIACGEADLPYLLGRLDDLGYEYDAGSYHKRPGVFKVYIYGLREPLISQNLLGNKHIPERYLRASEAQRRQLLAGIMDSDGTLGAHQVSVSMVREGLMRQILQLVRSLGYRATWSESCYDHNKGRSVYRVKFSSRWGQSPFDMPRKRLKFEEQLAKDSTIDLRLNSIVSVEPVDSVPVRCITVAHESALFVVGEGFLPTHNTRTNRKFDETTVEDMPSWQIQTALACDNLSKKYDTDFTFAVLIMIESGYPFRMKELRIERNDAMLRATYAKFDMVRQAIADNIPPTLCCALDSKEMKSCRARHACWLRNKDD
jgi:hypothetical protein